MGNHSTACDYQVISSPERFAAPHRPVFVDFYHNENSSTIIRPHTSRPPEHNISVPVDHGRPREADGHFPRGKGSRSENPPGERHDAANSPIVWAIDTGVKRTPRRARKISAPTKKNPCRKR